MIINYIRTSAFGWLLFGLCLALLWQGGSFVPVFVEKVSHGFTMGAAAAIAAVVAFGFMSAFSEYFGRIVKVESFVLAIFLGLAGQQLLAPLAESTDALQVVVNISAAIILLQGGLEIKFHNFKKLFVLIGLLSTFGLFATAALFSFGTFLIAQVIGISMLPHVALLLGAILASTDPAALVPLFNKLSWIDETARDIIISESAGTDVTGTILTLQLLALVSAVGGTALFATWGDIWTNGYAQVLTLAAAGKIGSEMLIGALVGYGGYIGLLAFEWLKKRSGVDRDVDAVMITSIGIATFALAYMLHGSGFLAVFIAGLLFNVTDHMKVTEHKVGGFIDAFFKPAVFVTLGSIIDFNLLMDYAHIGILSGVAFMIIRVVVVYVSLSPFRLRSARVKSPDKTVNLSWNDIAYIACVRETGAIPAVLLLAVKTSGIAGADMLVAVGTWVILLTLIIGPTYKIALAERFNIATRKVESTSNTHA